MLEVVLSLADGLEIRPYTTGFGAMTGNPGNDDPVCIAVALMTPAARGTVRLRSADPAAAPDIRQHYDTQPGDTRKLSHGVAAVREILSGTVTIGDPSWSTSQHLCGTAPMGDPTRVAVSLDAASASHLWIGPEGGSVLARGGVFVAAEGGPDVGTPVRLALTLPGGSFDALGVVRWTRPRSPLAAAGYGVTLVELDGDGKRAVEAFAAARAPMLYGK